MQNQNQLTLDSPLSDAFLSLNPASPSSYLTQLSFRLFLSWVYEMILLIVLFWRELAGLFASLSCSSHCSAGHLSRISPAMSCKKVVPQVENLEEVEEFSILDLPELALECILEKLPPDGLCNMASVCRCLRDRCRSNHLWERHMKKKWGRVMSHAAYRERKWFITSRKDHGASDGGKSKGWIASLSCVWPVSWLKLKIDGSSSRQRSCLPVDSIMFLCLSLESGKFWFPAQVYNREHGNAGFMLSCYDAELSYDCRTDSFHARYPPYSRRTMVMEEGVQWDRLRAPPVDTPAHELHMSDCLNDLRPGDHFEIQWRRNKEFPYGWWYGVVGHLELCDRNEHLCRCHYSDTVMLEFNQYTSGSRWRQATINRKDHREEGNEADGFYGGIRKLHNMEEIMMWKRLWPTEVLE